MNTAISVRLPKALADQLDSTAKETERPRSYIIQKALESYLEDYADLVSGMVLRGARIMKVQLYTYARPSPEGRCSPLSDGDLAKAASLVRGKIDIALVASGLSPGSIPVRRYGG